MPARILRGSGNSPCCPGRRWLSQVPGPPGVRCLQLVQPEGHASRGLCHWLPRGGTANPGLATPALFCVFLPEPWRGGQRLLVPRSLITSVHLQPQRTRSQVGGGQGGGGTGAWACGQQATVSPPAAPLLEAETHRSCWAHPRLGPDQSGLTGRADKQATPRSLSWGSARVGPAGVSQLPPVVPPALLAPCTASPLPHPSFPRVCGHC